MHNYKLSKKLERLFPKLCKKDKKLYEQILKKTDEIINCYDVDSYKNLRHNLKDYKRVHVGHFVLIFSYDKNTNLILFEDFDHHDKIYK